jgi:Sensors of blue-light using FAD
LPSKSPERDLVQIAYMSSVPADLAPADLDGPGGRSLQHGDAWLTGLLLHHGQHLYAILEGPRRRVFQRIEEIVAERRQRNLRILREEPIERRRFANWSFGVLPASNGETSPDDFLRHYCRHVS